MKKKKCCTWNDFTSTSAAEDNNWYSVIYANGLFVAVSSDNTDRVMYARWE